MELSNVVSKLNQDGWPARLTTKGHRIAVGKWWWFCQLTVKWDYEAKKLVVTRLPYWVAIFNTLIYAAALYHSLSKGWHTFALIILGLAFLNVVQFYFQIRNTKKLDAALKAV